MKSIIGMPVTYINPDGTHQLGILKTCDDRGVFVVFNCDGKWSKYKDYTAEKVTLNRIRPGWPEKHWPTLLITALNEKRFYLLTKFYPFSSGTAEAEISLENIGVYNSPTECLGAAILDEMAENVCDDPHDPSFRFKIDNETGLPSNYFVRVVNAKEAKLLKEEIEADQLPFG